MKFIFCFIFISIISLLRGQSTDSLLYQINSIENDTDCVNQLYTQGFNLRNSDPLNAQLFANSCYKRAVNCNSVKHLAKALNLLGVLSYKQSHYTKALQFQNNALKLNKSINYESGAAINLSNLGNIYSDLNYFTLAEKSYLEALHINNKLGNTKEIARCLINIGALKHSQKQNDVAILNLKQALIYANNIGNYELIATCNNNIGAALVEQNNLDTALLYFEDALKMRTMIDDEVDLTDSYINIATVMVKQKKYNEAQNYISLAENGCNNYELFDELAILYKVKAELYESQLNFEKANYWLKKHHNLKDSLTTLNNQNPEAFTSIELPEINNNNSFSLITLIIISILGIILSLIISYFIFKKHE